MSTKPVFIYDPSEKPYGPLSNHYKQEFEVRLIELPDPNDYPQGAKKNIERKRIEEIYRNTWPSVTNYIYANLLSIRSDQSGIKSTPADQVIDKFKLFYIQEYKVMLRSAYAKAYVALFNQNPNLIQILTNTGDAKILYISDNLMTGVESSENIKSIPEATNILDQALADDHNKWLIKKTDNDLFVKNPYYRTSVNTNYYGDNIIGEVLMQLRRNLQLVKNKDKIKEKLQKISTMLAVRLALEGRILLNDDLAAYAGSSYEQLAERFVTDKIRKMVLPEDQIQILVNNGRIEHMHELDDPCLLIMRLRQTLEKQQETRRNLGILYKYIDHIIEKNYPKIPKTQYEKARSQQLIKIPFDERISLAHRLYRLYTTGRLQSEELTAEIEQVVKSTNVISTGNDAEIISSNCVRNEVEEQGTPIKEIFFSAKGKGAFLPLSPVIFPTKFLVLDGFKYPSVSHYVGTALIKSCTFLYTSWEEAYMEILKKRVIPENLVLQDFYTTDKISEFYQEQRTKNMENVIQHLAKQALASKFKDRNLQNLLLYTEKSKLVWAEKNDFFLGNGTKEVHGKNIIGKLLAELRDQFYQDRQTEENIGKLSERDIDKLLSDKAFKDGNFLRGWFQMRLEDSCIILTIMRDYAMNKSVPESKLANRKFIKYVFYGIYQHCDSIYRASKKIKVQVPKDFIQLFSDQNPGFCSENKELIDTIWKYLVVTVYYLNQVNTGLLPLVDISGAISRAEYVVTNNRKCIPVYGDQHDDCKASALINLLCALAKFQEKLDVQKITISEHEVSTAVSIILGKKVIVTMEDPDEQKAKEENEDGSDSDQDFAVDAELDSEGEEIDDFAAQLEEELKNMDGEEVFGEEDDKSPVNPDALLDFIPDEYKKYIENKTRFTHIFNRGIQALKQEKINKNVLFNRVNFFSTWD